MIDDIRETFQKYTDEYIRFNKDDIRVVSKCPDLCAFILLDKLVPSKSNISLLIAAVDDEIWLWTDINKLAEVATEEDIKFLVGCGVRYSGKHDCLCMFV